MADLNRTRQRVMIILCLLVSNEAVHSVRDRLCGPPPDPDVGQELIRPTVNVYTSGSRAHYMCGEGYIHVRGALTYKCSKRLEWQREQSGLLCEVQKCQSPPQPGIGEELIPAKNVHAPGSLLYYKCKPGYERIDGEKLLTCSSTLEWKPVSSDLKCDVQKCPSPPQPGIGEELITAKNVHTPGSLLYYRCKPGYEHIGGEKLLNCSSTLEWKPVSSDLKCDAQKCQSPQQPGIGEELITAKNVHTPGSLLYYKCKPGYEHIDGEKLLNCSSTLEWKPVYSDLKCDALQCESPPEPGIGEMIRPMQIKRLYPPGSHLRYKCKPGYSHIEGEKLLKCTLTLSWETLNSDLKCEEPKLKRKGGCDPRGCGAQLDQHIEHQKMDGSPVDQSSVAVDQSSVVVDQSSVAVGQGSVAADQGSVASRSQSVTAFALLEVVLVVALYIHI